MPRRKYCNNSGIKATDNVTGQEFFFYTDLQNGVENAMLLMGYGSSDYNLSFFKDKVPPFNKKSYNKRS
jgi:hypothetical protein